MKICPGCAHQNKDSDRFCTQCGASIKQTSVYSSQVSQHSSEASPKYCHVCGSVSPADAEFCQECGASLDSANKTPDQKGTDEKFRSDRSGKWIWISAGVLLIVLAIGIGGWFFLQNSEAPHESDEKIADPKIVKDKNEKNDDPSVSDGSEEDTDHEDTDNKEDPKKYSSQLDENSGSGIELNIPQHPAPDYYSAPAVLQMIMDYQGMPVSLEEAADQLGTSEGKVTDFRSLVSELNSVLEKKAISHRYSGIYLSESEWNESQKSMMSERIESALSDSLPAVAVIGKNAASGLEKNAYSLISGEEDGIYTLMIPTPDDVVTQKLTLDELIAEMEMAGFHCYIV